MPRRTVIPLTADILLLIPVVICRQSVFMADFYACHTYPVLSAVLSAVLSKIASVADGLRSHSSGGESIC